MPLSRQCLVRGVAADAFVARLSLTLYPAQTMASALLALGVTISIEGGCDTYMRTGKLFPGPHLFAGAGESCRTEAATHVVQRAPVSLAASLFHP